MLRLVLSFLFSSICPAEPLPEIIRANANLVHSVSLFEVQALAVSNTLLFKDNLVPYSFGCQAYGTVPSHDNRVSSRMADCLYWTEKGS